MKFLMNIYNPELPDVYRTVLRSFEETQEEAWQHHLNWLQGKIIGDPVATEFYTVEQLKAMNLVGVYAEDEHTKGGHIE